MVVDVAPLLRGEVKKIDIDYMLSPEQLDGVVFEDARVCGLLRRGDVRAALQRGVRGKRLPAGHERGRARPCAQLGAKACTPLKPV